MRISFEVFEDLLHCSIVLSKNLLPLHKRSTHSNSPKTLSTLPNFDPKNHFSMPYNKIPPQNQYPTDTTSGKLQTFQPNSTNIDQTVAVLLNPTWLSTNPNQTPSSSWIRPISSWSNPSKPNHL